MILDYTQDEKALKGACDCSQGKYLCHFLLSSYRKTNIWQQK